ncbi:phage tail protein [Acinetobacter sp. ANC 5502]
MQKPQQLKDFLVNSISELKVNPDRLLVFVDEGHLRSTLANGLSFEYAYKLTLILTDYAGDLAAISVPLLDWVRVHQSELLTNLDQVKNAISFEAEILANDKVDLVVQLPLTERVIVKQQDDGSLNISYPAEPQYQKAQDSTLVTLYNKDGSVLAAWQSADPQQRYSL